MTGSTGFVASKSAKKHKKSGKTSRKIAFLVKPTQGGAYFYRCVIPNDLQPFLENKPEFRISLKTGLYCDAKGLAKNLDQLAKRLFYAVRIRQQYFPLALIKGKVLEKIQQILVLSGSGGYLVTKQSRSLKKMEKSKKVANALKELLLRRQIFEIVVPKMSIKEIELYMTSRRYPKSEKEFIKPNDALKTRAEFF